MAVWGLRQAEGSGFRVLGGSGFWGFCLSSCLGCVRWCERGSGAGASHTIASHTFTTLYTYKRTSQMLTSSHMDSEILNSVLLPVVPVRLRPPVLHFYTNAVL